MTETTRQRLVIIAGQDRPDGPRPGSGPPHLVRRPNEVVLDTLFRLGWTGTHACRRGGCGVCLVRVHSGAVQHGPHTARALSPEREAGGFALACRAVPTTPSLEIEFVRGEPKQVVPIARFLGRRAKESNR
jgi:ferredoxin